MRFSGLAAIIPFTALVSASPLQNHLFSRQNGANSTSACASVSALAASQVALAPSATPTVPAQLAYDCISSVPLNKSAALHLIDSFRPYWQWQSTLAYLKDPPAEYVEKIQAAVDVFSQLDEIQSNVSSGAFTNEYEFGWAVYHLLQSTHDGHFVYVPDSVGKVFNWARPIPLVSVSEDGASPPVPYAYPDVLGQIAGNISYTPSPIVKINGEDATTWLENWSQFGSLQDRDALYNNVFYELAVISLGTSGSGMGTFSGGGRGRWVYPGPDTTLEFKNGTKVIFDNFAKVLVPFDGIVDGESLYQILFTVPSDTSLGLGVPSPSVTAMSSSAMPMSSSVAPATPTSTPAPGYPPPVYKESHNLIGGYYIDEPGYEDVAVLSVPSFVSLTEAEIPFQQTAEKFLAAATKAGKTKLVVDVSANGGGTILQGYDLFKQLFPTLEAFAAADRHRAFQSTNLLGEKFSEISGTVPRVYAPANATLEEIEYDIVASNFNYRTDEKPSGAPFTSWAAKFGPQMHHGDNFTNLFRWNLSDVLTPYNSGGIYVHGYGNVTGLPQPFPTSNVVVMTDGYCASTCTIFSALMRDIAGVEYIAFGGRSNLDLTQAVGGVKGTNDLPWDYIQYLVSLAYEHSTPEEQAYYNTTELITYNDATPFYRATPSTSYNINFRDGIRRGDFEEQTPLQFVYEPADCRILYTKEMTVDVTATWKAAADSKWGSASDNKCVAGSLCNGTVPYHGQKRSTWRHMAKRWSKVDEYPMDLYTDLKGTTDTFGYMMP